MSRIFLSHSSNDDFEAVAVRDWLIEEGWDDIFLDLDPAQGIHPGERWERTLHEAANRCEAVLFLVSRSWLASDWCRSEYELARRLNKRIFAVLIEDIAIGDLPLYLRETYQMVALAAGGDHQLRRVVRPGTHEERHVHFSAEGLSRLKAGLARAGLDPDFFAWPPSREPNRAPYRGLEPLAEVDTGIFFGRDGPIIEALDSLRGLKEAAAPRLFVILGASGAGKSSFLRAGLLPRLARDDRNFLPLPVIRPQRAAINGANGLVAALAAAAADHRLDITRARLREAVAGGANALRPILRDITGNALPASLPDGAATKPPTLVIAVDQGEELFRAEGSAEGEELLTLLRDLTSANEPAVIAIFAIRSDSYDALERAKPLEGLRQQTLPLLPMPRGAYQTVIEGPARRLAQTGRKFDIDPGLTQSLLEDIDKGGGDALPLLAFTLEQLYRDYGAAKRLTRADCASFGGLAGAIDAAISRVFAAADTEARIPRDHEARLALLRRGLIPWLAGVDPETKTPRRRRAPAAQIPEEARPLIDLLVEQRLLTRDVDERTGETTIEPAHEALLRQWGRLKGWLDEDFGRLATLEGVKRAARDWDANARQPAWAAHGGARLEEANRLDARPDLAAQLDATDRAYLAACREKENAAREAEEARRRAEADLEREKTRDARRVAWISSAGLIAALGLALLAGSQWRSAKTQWQSAETQRERAEKTLALATATANGLVFDLAQKLRNVAGIPASLVADILTRARKLQEQLTAGGATSSDLQRSKAAALLETSQTFLTTGDTKGALAAAHQAQALMEALSASAPGNAGWQNDLSISYERIGDVQAAQGDLKAALKSYSDSRAIFERLAKAEPGNTLWKSKLSASYNEVGWVQEARGDREGALKSYSDSLAIRERLAKADPGNTGWQYDLSVSYERVGGVQAAHGDLKAALKSYSDSRAIAERLAKADPGNTGLQRDLSVSYEKIGGMQAAQNDLKAALKSYSDSLAIRERLAQSDPGNAGWQRDLSVSYEKIGGVQAAQNDLKAALKSYSDSLAIRERLAKSDPSNAGWQQDLSVSYNTIGGVQAAQGDLTTALKSYSDSFAIRERLAQSDPSNAGWQDDLSVSYDRVGGGQAAQGDLKAALKSFSESLAIRERLAKVDPGNVGWQRDLSFSYNTIGDVQAFLGDLKAALKSYSDSRAIRERLAKADPGNAWQPDLSVSYEKVGDVQAAQGDFQASLKSYSDSLAIRERLAQSDPGNAFSQHDLSVAYGKIGDVQAAQDDLKAALKSYSDSLAIRERLAKADPGNALWQDELSLAYAKLADAYSKSNETAKARDAFTAGRAIIEKLVEHSDQALWKQELAWFDERIAELGKTSPRR
jgi:tetratricopeptide (TPR) repeat protein